MGAGVGRDQVQGSPSVVLYLIFMRQNLALNLEAQELDGSVRLVDQKVTRILLSVLPVVGIIFALD